MSPTCGRGVWPARVVIKIGEENPWPWPVPAATERCCLTTANVDSPRRLMAASGQRPSGVFVCCIRRCLNCTKAAALPTNSWYEHPKTRTTRSSWSVVIVRPSSGGSDPRPNRRTLERRYPRRISSDPCQPASRRPSAYPSRQSRSRSSQRLDAAAQWRLGSRRATQRRTHKVQARAGGSSVASTGLMPAQ